MLRAVVTFLVSVPMLMPPGMCICQFAPTGKASAATWSEAARQPEVGHTSSRPDCRCDSCRELAATAGLPTGNEGNTSTPSDEVPPSGPGKHAPGCPAALGAIPTKMVVSTVSIHLDTNLLVCFVSLAVGPTSSVGRSRECMSPPAASPPLFISHCTLLI